MDPQLDDANCGGCGRQCAEDRTCVEGGCACRAPLAACGDTCVDLAADPAHCGDCNAACPNDHACVDGECVIDCPADTAECGEVCANLQTSSAHCGACDSPCPQLHRCAEGECREIPYDRWDGIRRLVQRSDLDGFRQCYRADYRRVGDSLAEIMANCSGPRLIVGCREVGSFSLKVAAQGAREDVFRDVGAGAQAAHVVEGVAWYYDQDSSWGFAPAGAPIDRRACDQGDGQGLDRLCWHTDNGRMNGGWRCGPTTGLNNSVDWEKLVYHLDP